MPLRRVKHHVALQVDPVVAVGVINLMRTLLSLGLVVCVVLLWGRAQVARATVLPEERADIMYHSYEGGGVTVSGPSILVRKNTSTNTSVFYNYYIDHVSSASLDVLLGGSPYQEKRTEQSGGIDYLHGKTTTSLSYTSSVENDYKSGTLNFNISQDFFGDLSTLTLGYTRGNDDVTMRGLSYDLAKVDRQNYRVGFSQILSKNFVMGANWETITDDASSLNGSTVTLNNPYRSYSFLDTSTGNRGFAQEKYPNTHTSNAFAINGSYFLSYRAALHGEVKIYQDSWGVNATTYQLSYTYPIRNWIFDFRGRWYNQGKANFYSDMFDYQDQYTFMARDKELATFQSMGLGVTASMEFAKNGWGWIDKGSLNLSWDHIQFNYKDFRDVTVGGTPGTEPLYAFGADIYQFFVSFWY
jgi:hypothetical protein